MKLTFETESGFRVIITDAEIIGYVRKKLAAEILGETDAAPRRGRPPKNPTPPIAPADSAPPATKPAFGNGVHTVE